MHTNFRLNPQFFSLSPNRTLRPTSRTILQSLLFAVGCLLLLGLLCLPTFAQVDPTICIDPGGTGVIAVNVTNTNAALAAGTFTAGPIPANAGFTVIANSCSANTGVCTVTVDGLNVNWSGNLAAGQTVTIIYRVQVAPTVAAGTILTVNNVAGPAGVTAPATSGFTVGCQASPTPNIRVSDQKPGSVLVFPYYTSKAAFGAIPNDTRISMTNVSTLQSSRANQSFVHVFLIDGVSCMQTDFFVCLTPNASFSFSAFSYDPLVTGYVIAIAVDGTTGLPVQNNVLIGNAFVNTEDYFGNYGAESFVANSTNLYVDLGATARLFFDGVGYDSVPNKFAVEIQSPVDVPSPFQKIVTAGMIGDLTTGEMSGAVQTVASQVFNEAEDSRSISAFVTGACQGVGTLSDTLRVAGKLSGLIPTGKSGTVKFTLGGAVGVLLTPRGAKWGGIRTLHKTATVATSIIMPVFIPQTCPL